MLEFLLWPVFLKFVFGFVACGIAFSVGFVEYKGYREPLKWYEELVRTFGMFVAGVIVLILAHF